MSKKKIDIDYVAHEGENFTIEWYFNKNHRSDALEYHESLSISEQMDILILFKTIASEGQIKNKTKFRNEGDKIYAFKTDQERFLCFFCHNKKIIVTNGFRKKSQKLPLKEKDKAKDRRNDYLKRVSRGEYYND